MLFWMCAGDEEDEDAQGLRKEAAKDKKIEHQRQKKEKTAKLQKAMDDLKRAQKDMEHEDDEE